MKATQRASIVNENQVSRFLKKHPIVRNLIESGKQVHEIMEIQMQTKSFPFSGLLADCYQFLNFEPIEVIETSTITVLVYVERSEYVNSLIDCMIRNEN